jgi:fused signal recognition particle receptor
MVSKAKLNAGFSHSCHVQLFQEKTAALATSAACGSAAPSAEPLPDQAPPMVETGIEAKHVVDLESVVDVEPVEDAEAVQAKKSWFKRLKTGLSKTGSSITSVFRVIKVDEALFEELEGALLMADCGMPASRQILQALRTKVKSDKIEDAAQVRVALSEVIAAQLAPLARTLEVPADPAVKPWVVMIAGVNGAGKTTSIGKITHHLSEAGHSVILAAADTFRAAAREQLAVWGSRNQVSVISQEGADPGAVVYDAVQSARARGVDVVIADTAGRLPTQLHLMEELKKIARVCGKALNGAPQERWLVIDGNTGQNAVAQVKSFNDALQLTGLIVTKLDGTAKGGVLCAIAQTCPVPILFIGVGEALEDLQPFDAKDFAAALVGI